MPKRKQTNKKANKPRPTNGRKANTGRRNRVRSPRLPPAAMDYMRLVRDPCNAKLCGYYGGPSGIVQRFKSTLTINTGASSTSGVYYWEPGNGNVQGWLETTGANVTISVPGAAATGTPGQAFLASSAVSVRPLAACVRVFATASMNNRTGFISAGVVNAGEANSMFGTAGLTVSQVASTLSDAEDVMTPREYKWFPGDEDIQYIGPGAGNAGILLNDQNALVIAWDSFPAGSPIRLELTLVAEWQPKINSGMPTNGVIPSNPSANIALVKSALYAADPKWWMKMDSGVKGAVSGYMSGGYLGGLVGGVAGLLMG